jgi:hypothetical protein
LAPRSACTDSLERAVRSQEGSGRAVAPYSCGQKRDEQDVVIVDVVKTQMGRKR